MDLVAQEVVTTPGGVTFTRNTVLDEPIAFDAVAFDELAFDADTEF
jgi:hypothetical protein